MSLNTMKAVKILAAGHAEVQDVPIPSLSGREDSIKVKVSCVAVNPIDWKILDFMSVPGSTLGCDFSGTVVEVGPAVTKKWRIGDRIASWVHGGNSVHLEDGSFAEYVVSKGDLGIKVPDWMTDEEAASPPGGVGTAGMALYQMLGLPMPGQQVTEEKVLIYGGSGAMGALSIQFAKLSGCEVITTCSPRNFDYVKSLGADAVFDYKDPNCGERIREYTQDGLKYVMDTISEGSSAGICAAAVSKSSGGTIVSLLPYEKDIGRDDVEVKLLLSLSLLGDEYEWGPTKFPPNKDDFEFGKMWYGIAERLIAEKKVKVHTPQAEEGGLEGVFVGMQKMREGKVSGVKLVYKL